MMQNVVQGKKIYASSNKLLQSVFFDNNVKYYRNKLQQFLNHVFEYNFYDYIEMYQ